MMMQKVIVEDVDLFDLADKEVYLLKINGIRLGDEFYASRLEVTADKQRLEIFAKDEFIAFAKIQTEDIQKIEFRTHDGAKVIITN